MQRVILIGLSGTGKSSLAPMVAAELGFSWVDTDDEVTRRFGRSIPDVFRDFGESTFRAVEREIVRDACTRRDCVIATGGGAVLDEANWSCMRPGAVIVHLRASTSEIVARLHAAQRENPEDTRPLLAGEAPERRLDELWSSRQRLYDRADVEVQTDGKSQDEIAREIVDAVRHASDTGLIPVTSIDVPAGRSDLYAGAGIVRQAARLIRSRWPDTRRVWIITDQHVQEYWGNQIRRQLTDAGIETDTYAVVPGESSKSLREIEKVLDWMIRGRVSRQDVVVALGGGVVGDLAGFCAAVALRGVGLVQIPTSLLAMVDSSVGGKTGVNHELGKNLIGSFYQPQLVIADPSVLETLPPRELSAGWAEIIKHGMIERSATGSVHAGLLEAIESLDDGLCDIDPREMANLVAWNISVKADVVRQDEREAGLRRLLNYGHTLGHAMEAAGFRYIHGEAVALGMRGAVRLSHHLGMCDAPLIERQDSLLNRAGLPSTFEGELDVVLDRLTRDKKVVHNRLTWILPVAAGTVTTRQDVPIDPVVQVARELGAD